MTYQCPIPITRLTRKHPDLRTNDAQAAFLAKSSSRMCAMRSCRGQPAVPNQLCIGNFCYRKVGSATSNLGTRLVSHLRDHPIVILAPRPNLNQLFHS
eukprot:g1857.t1